MFRSIVLSVGMVLLWQTGQGQDGISRDPDYDCAQCNEDSIQANVDRYPGLQDRYDYRLKSYDFFRRMLKISAPSTISPPFLDLRKTYHGPQKKPFILHANIQTPVGLGGYRWGLFSLHVIPQFKVRIFQNDDSFQTSFLPADESQPVRTPSYLPRITLMKTFDSWWEDGFDSRSKYVGLSFFHHSNGQDGPEFSPDGSINIYNGNFGEQVAFELIFGGIREGEACQSLSPVLQKKKFQPRGDSLDTYLFDREFTQNTFYYRLGLELHHPRVLTNQEFVRYDLYGRTRLNFELGYLIAPFFTDRVYSRMAAKEGGGWLDLSCPEQREMLRFILDGSVILDPDYQVGDMVSREDAPLQRRINLRATAYWRIPSTPASALFFRIGYTGSDQYNIYFQQSYLEFSTGLALAYFGKVN